MNNIQHSNISEEEMGQIHAIHLNENAIAAVRARMPSGASAKFCTDCEEAIPLQRRLAVQGCMRCIPCQTIHER